MIFDDPRMQGFIEGLRRADSATEDGLVYEDDSIRVESVDGQVTMTGKPIRCPFIYPDEGKR